MSKVENVVVKLAEFAATGPVLKRLVELDLLVHLKEYEDHNTSVSGYLVNPSAFCIMIGADKRFYPDVWNFLHEEIRDPKGFRQIKQGDVKTSVQCIVGTNIETGLSGYVHFDIDAHNTQDFVNIIAHLWADVFFKRRRA